MTLFDALSLFGSAVGFLLAVILGLLRYTDAQKRREYEKAFADQRDEFRRLDSEQRRSLERLQAKNEDQDRENRRTVEKMHANEIANLELKHQLDLSNANRDSILRDIEEIKSEMVTKSQFDTLQKSLDSVLRSLRPGTYRSSTPMPEGR